MLHILSIPREYRTQYLQYQSPSSLRQQKLVWPVINTSSGNIQADHGFLPFSTGTSGHLTP